MNIVDIFAIFSTKKLQRYVNFIKKNKTINTMNEVTIQDKLSEIGRTYRTISELNKRVDDIVFDIVTNTDDRLFSINRSWTSYGTWKITFLANDYHFGSDFTKRLNKMSFITHEEEAEFSIEDFSEQIEEVCWDYANDASFDEIS